MGFKIPMDRYDNNYSSLKKDQMIIRPPSPQKKEIRIKKSDLFKRNWVICITPLDSIADLLWNLL